MSISLIILTRSIHILQINQFVLFKIVSYVTHVYLFSTQFIFGHVLIGSNRTHWSKHSFLIITMHLTHTSNSVVGWELDNYGTCFHPYLCFQTWRDTNVSLSRTNVCLDFIWYSILLMHEHKFLYIDISWFKRNMTPPVHATLFYRGAMYRQISSFTLIRTSVEVSKTIVYDKHRK